MRTTLDIPEDLLHTAMQAAQAKTRTQVIVMALEELIRRHNIARLKQFKGKVDLEIDLDRIRGRT
jgi:hypothetical protein